jgi:hypothetical protein
LTRLIKTTAQLVLILAIAFTALYALHMVALTIPLEVER